MNIISSRIAAIVLLSFASLSTVACSQASEDEASSSAAQTSAHAEPGPVQSVTDDGRDAVGALTQKLGSFFYDQNDEYSAPLKSWLESTATEVHIERHDGGITFYFAGDLVEGDVVNGSRQLVLEEKFNGEWGPGFFSHIGDGSVPSTAVPLTGIDFEAVAAIAGIARLAVADPTSPASVEFKKYAAAASSVTQLDVQHLAPGDTSFQLSAMIVEGGDMIVGNANLALRATRDTTMPKFNIVNYTATTTIERDDL